MLELENVSKVYRVGLFGSKSLHAVEGVSFSIRRGEVVALIGESGSGKSTIGKMVLRLLRPTSGRILFQGNDINTFEGSALKAYYRQVQGVFQDPFSAYNPIFKADRIFDRIREEFFPQVRFPEWQERVDAMLQQVGLNPASVRNKFPHQLSGGQLQRLLIARALLLDIALLVADEVTSMLDASTRIDVLNLLAGLNEKGLSILFITHDLSLAHYISHRAIVLYRGHVVESGDVRRVLNTPRHPYTQMLVESVPRLDKRWALAQAPASPVVDAQHERVLEGCVYRSRCPIAGAECARPPKLVSLAPDHAVACWKAETETQVAAALSS